MAVVLALGCPGKRSDAPTGSLALPTDDEASTAPRGVVEGPGTWRESGGMSLTLPEGWRWQPLPAGAGLVLDAEHLATGVELQVWAFAPSGPVGPRPREGCTWMFSDAASHRRVPLLAPALTATCVAEEPTTPTVQGWYGRVGGREIHVEVITPHGRLIEGRQVVEPLLASLEG